MIKVSKEKIEKKALQFTKKGMSWHFHMLTSACQLNESGRFAFILENSTDSEVFVTYSDAPYMDLGKKLVKLLHKGVLDKKSKAIRPKISHGAKKIITRAKKLNQQGKFWHHHMLFPDCIFNDSGKWLIVLEDQETGQVLRAVSDKEPTADLKEIEVLYYQQTQNNKEKYIRRIKKIEKCVTT